MSLLEVAIHVALLSLGYCAAHAAVERVLFHLSRREADPDLLERKMVSSRGVRQVLDLGGSAEDYAWYIAMHRQQSGQQAGFGMGFERFVRYVCGLRSVADA